MTSENRSHPTPFNEIILSRFQKEYKSDPAWRSIIEEQKRRILADKPDLKVTVPFIIYVFGHPEIAAQFPSSALETLEATDRAQKTQQADDVLETVFFIDEDDNNISTTHRVQKPATADSPTPHVDTVEAPTRQTIAMVHTHPPFGGVLKPSVYIDGPKGQEVGDLTAFATFHEGRAESIREGARPCAVAKPLSIIMKSYPDDEIERMLFILETDWIASLDKKAYLEHLRTYGNLVHAATTQDETVRALRNLGYNAASIEISTDDLYASFPFIGPEELEQIAQGLGFKPAI